MKHLLMASLMLLASLSFSNKATAQSETEELYYYYTDVNTNTIYTLYLKIMGYQVEVWTRTSTDNKWHQAKVNYSSDEEISFTSAASGKKYHATLDPNNQDGCIVYSEDYSNKWKYWLKD